MNGVLVVDKPVGPTSHDVVARVRRALGETRIGHTGTLDPAASGVLPLVIGRATRLARFLSASDKVYEAVIRLGWCTETGDAMGPPVGDVYEGTLPGSADIAAALETFRCTFLQQPPAYSAKKIDGQRSYALARAKVHRLPAPVEVTAHAIELLDADDRQVTLRLECSAGFYVRTLARDLGDRLGVGAHLAALRRTRSGDYDLSAAIALDVVDRDRDQAAAAIIPPRRLLPRLAWVVLTPEGCGHARHGRDLGAVHVCSHGEPSGAGGETGKDDRWVRLLDAGGDLLGLAQPRGASGLLHPSVMLM